MMKGKLTVMRSLKNWDERGPNPNTIKGAYVMFFFQIVFSWLHIYIITNCAYSSFIEHYLPWLLIMSRFTNFPLFLFVCARSILFFYRVKIIVRVWEQCFYAISPPPLLLATLLSSHWDWWMGSFSHCWFCHLKGTRRWRFFCWAFYKPAVGGSQGPPHTLTDSV